MMWGLDVLGLAKYPSVAIKNWPLYFACGVFANTFGSVWGALEKLLATGKCPRVRIHAIWEDNHTYNAKKHDPIIMKELQRANALKKKFPQVHVQFSPFCEHNIKGKTLTDLLDKCGDASRDVEIVNAPYKGDFSKRFMNEVHGSHTPPKGTGQAYQYSYDGTNAVDSNVEGDKVVHKDAEVFYLWHPRFNLKWSMKDTTPRPQRKAKPDQNLIESVAYLATNKGDTKLPKSWLLKSHAEKHGPEDKKGDKLLIISPQKGKEIVLKSLNGKLVDTLRYYGPFDGGGYRYYSVTWGYLDARKAEKLQGSPFCEVFIDGKKFGVVNAGFRDPSWR